MVIRLAISLTILVLLTPPFVIAEDLKQQPKLSSVPTLSYEEVQDLLTSNETACREATANIFKLCHTAKLRDRVKLASLITTCIENSLTTHGYSHISTWDDDFGLQRVSEAHIETLMSISLPSLKALCDKTELSSPASLAKNSLLYEEVISNSSSNVIQTSRVLKSCTAIVGLSTFRENFDELAALLESMLPHVHDITKASNTHRSTFEMFSAKMRKKFRIFQSQIETQLGQVESMLKTAKYAYADHRKSVWEMKPYINKFGSLADIEVRLRKLESETAFNNRASSIAYSEWLTRRGIAPQKCFLHVDKPIKNEYCMRGGKRRDHSKGRNSKQGKGCEEGDLLWAFLRKARRFYSAQLGRWLSHDGCDSARKKHDAKIKLNKLQKDMEAGLICVYTHNTGVLMLFILVLAVCVYVRRRMYIMKRELSVRADELIVLFEREFGKQRQARHRKESGTDLYDISKRVNELMTLCDYFDALLRSCDGFCKEIERAMNSGMGCR